MQAVDRAPDATSALLNGTEFVDIYSNYTQNIRSEHNSRCGTGRKPIEVKDAEAASQELEGDDSSFKGQEIFGNAMEITQIPFASGSTSLGMDWIPAPMKFYSPLSHYSHEFPIPSSPLHSRVCFLANNYSESWY
jgi:hypothetical protein